MGLFDQIKNAQFMNETTTMQEDIGELQRIIGKVSGEHTKNLEQEIRNLEYGLKGEEAIIYELKHSGIPMLVLQDLYLEYEGLSAQIDFLIITRDKHYIIECKNMYGDVVVESTGDFMRKIGRETRKIYSPITQCERHLQVIKEVRKASKNIVTQHFFENNFENKYLSIVVMANPTGKINVKCAPKDIKDKIISVDQLVRFMKNHNTSKELISEKQMKAIATFYLQSGKKNPRNYMEQYRKLVDNPEHGCEASAKEITVTADVEKALEPTVEELCSANEVVSVEGNISLNIPRKICGRCGSEMVQRVAKRGDNAGNVFWGCASYPKCRYIEAVEEESI
ncbi:MAG: NERD domain-containing protein [Eubacteriales bacterium]